MTPIDNLTKHPIEAIYSHQQPNDPIDLGQHDVSFKINDKNIETSASVRMRFVPQDRLEFNVPIPDKSIKSYLELIRDKSASIKLVIRSTNVVIEAIRTRYNTEFITFVPRYSVVWISQTTDQIANARLHLFNFPSTFGPDVYSFETRQGSDISYRKCSRIIMQDNAWRITICESNEAENILELLKDVGGFALTAVGEVVREDGSTFSTDDLKDLLLCVHYFLSFAFGRWVGLGLTHGFDLEGQRVYEEWGLRYAADGAWHPNFTWFDNQRAELLPQVFPGFANLWKNETWKTPLKHAIYWYLGANDRRVGIGVDSGLIIAQSALETLAWTYCVLDRKMISSTAFKQRGLSASDKIRLLISAFNIPHEIPPMLISLNNKPGKKWEDGPDAITGIRNSLVHSSRSDNLPNDSYLEAWNLSLWYIELVLLHLCGHVGQYANRLNFQRYIGTVEKVPWAK